MVEFTGSRRSGRQGIRTLIPLFEETALAERLGKPYPTTFRSSGPPGSRTPISVCKAGVVPLDQQPDRGNESRPGRTRTCANLCVRQASWPLNDGTNGGE